MINLSNDLLFRLLMENKVYCMYVIETLLGIKLLDITILSPQLSIEADILSKGVRLDIRAISLSGKVFNVEMQTGKTLYIGKRFRYYQSMTDMGLLKKGDDYDKLEETYIIFICTFDQFGKELFRYSFTPQCQEDESLQLDSGLAWLFFNTKSRMDGIPEDIRNLLFFIEDSSKENAVGPMLEDMYRDAEALCTGDWREQIMTLDWKLKDREELGRYQGEAEGRIKGEAEGRIMTQIDALDKLVKSGMPKEKAINILELPPELVKQYENMAQ